MPLSTTRIAWRNLGRNRRRTLLAVGAIALGQLTLVFINGMMAGWWEDMLATVTGPLAGHVQVHHKAWREERALDLFMDDRGQVMREIEALPDVKRVSPRIYAAVLAASGETGDQPADAEPAMIVGVDTAVESGEGGLLEHVAEEALPRGRTALIGKVLAARLDIGPGAELALIGQDADGFPVSDLFKVSGLVGGNVDVVKRLGIVMAISDAGEFLGLPDQAHEFVVHGADSKEAESLAREVSALPSLKGAEALPWREAKPELVRMLDMKAWFDVIFLLIVFVAAAAGIANTAMMSAFERTHEFGMLLAIGARPARIVRMVLVESVIIGLLGVALGSVLGSALVLVTSHTGINYAALAQTPADDFVYGGMSISYVMYPKFELKHIVLGLWAVTLTSVLASLWPAAIAARLEPVEAMRS
ncbi:ABC transporter permease [Verrucomicrobiota bacterium]